MKSEHSNPQHGISWRTESLKVIPRDKRYYSDDETLIEWKYIEAVGEIASSGGHLVTPLSHDGSLPEGKILAVIGDTVTISPVIERGQAVLHAGDTAVIPVFPGEVPAKEIAANGGQFTITLVQMSEISYLKH